MTGVPPAARKNRAWREVAEVDRALDEGRIDEDGWFDAMRALITPAYLAAADPRGQSGHSGEEQRRRHARSLVCDAFGSTCRTSPDLWKDSAMQPASRVAGPGDIGAVTEAMVTAFYADPVWGPYTFPDPDRRRDQSRPFWEFCVRAAMRFPWTRVTPGCEAAAVWIPPGEVEMTPEQEDELESLVEDVLGRRQSRTLLDVFAQLDEEHPHDEPHHYLSLLATHDDHRGRGLGMGLLASCLEVIDGEHSPAYLESTNPANDGRYMRHGFEPRGAVTISNGHTITTMWRPAR